MFIKYCVFSEFLKIFWTLYSLGVSVCTHTRQVENHRCSRAGRVKKNHNILRKKSIFYEHPVVFNFWCAAKRIVWEKTPTDRRTYTCNIKRSPKFDSLKCNIIPLIFYQPGRNLSSLHRYLIFLSSLSQFHLSENN